MSHSCKPSGGLLGFWCTGFCHHSGFVVGGLLNLKYQLIHLVLFPYTIHSYIILTLWLGPVEFEIGIDSSGVVPIHHT